ncbi:MAG: hypothetical protein K0R00_293 [Herbinix sp.]|jgi:transcriptional antiterminator NusG|nr:hypothetical protein [Herbinix sp.]
MSWYALFVETGYEDDVCYYIDKVKTYLLEDVEYNLLVPKRKIYERKQGMRYEVIKIMFPGYILVETDNIIQFYRKAKGTPHIIKFLREYDYFHEIKVDEIQKLLHLSNPKGLIDVSQAYVVNDKIRISDGPLLGQEGLIKKIDKRKGRAKVEFIINSNSLLIDLGINIIQKLME